MLKIDAMPPIFNEKRPRDHLLLPKALIALAGHQSYNNATIQNGTF